MQSERSDVRAIDPGSLNEEERRVIAGYWRSRGVGEMGAERFFRRLTEDLRQLGAPASLLEHAKLARRDEAKHGHWGRDWAVFFGHADDSDPVAERTRPLTFPGASERDNRLLRVAFCAMLETVGCHVLREVRPRILHPGLRENNRQHLADEVRHARVAWAALHLLDPNDRNRVRHFMPLLLETLPQPACCGPERDDLDALVPWGYFTPTLLRAGYQRALDEVIRPGLTHLELFSFAASRAA